MSHRHIVRVKISHNGRVIADHEYYPYTKYDEPETETEHLENGMMIETTYIDEY